MPQHLHRALWLWPRRLCSLGHNIALPSSLLVATYPCTMHVLQWMKSLPNRGLSSAVPRSIRQSRAGDAEAVSPSTGSGLAKPSGAPLLFMLRCSPPA